MRLAYRRASTEWGQPCTSGSTNPTTSGDQHTGKCKLRVQGVSKLTGSLLLSRFQTYNSIITEKSPVISIHTLPVLLYFFPIYLLVSISFLIWPIQLVLGLIHGLFSSIFVCSIFTLILGINEKVLSFSLKLKKGYPLSILSVGLDSLGVTCSPQGPTFAGSKPAEVDGFFQDVKILSTSPPGGTLSWGSRV